MTQKRLAARITSAAALGLAAVASCAGAAPASAGHDAIVEPLSPSGDAVEASRHTAAEKEPDAGPAGDAGPHCPYGELSDPHRGFVRCLGPDERDAGWLPPPGEPPAASAPEAVKPAPEAVKPAPVGPPPVVEVGAPKFENGEVARAEKVMNGLAVEFGRCVAEHGGLSGAAGTLKVQFLVRARGRAEGVEVLSAKGIGAEAATCVRVLLKNKPIGPPTSDPVGVTVTIGLKAPAK